MSDRKRRNAPRVESATAAYKRQLNAFFDKGVVPDSIKGKLQGEAPEATGRQKALRAIREASSQAKLVKAIDAFMKDYEVPDDMDICIRKPDANTVLVLNTGTTTGTLRAVVTARPE